MRMLTDVLDDLRRENERLTAQLAEARAHVIAEVKAEVSHRVSGGGQWTQPQKLIRVDELFGLLDALAPAPPGSVLVSREDAEKLDSILKSIEDNSCCQPCREAGLWAAKARRLLGLSVEGQS